MRFQDPTNPRRVYVIDELLVHTYPPEEILRHQELSHAMGVLPTGWTHTFQARWHAEDDGSPRFGATLQEAFTHRWGTPEEQALARVKAVMLPEVKIETPEEDEDEGEGEEP